MIHSDFQLRVLMSIYLPRGMQWQNTQRDVIKATLHKAFSRVFISRAIRTFSGWIGEHARTYERERERERERESFLSWLLVFIGFPGVIVWSTTFLSGRLSWRHRFGWEKKTLRGRKDTLESRVFPLAAISKGRGVSQTEVSSTI